jgi:hypothetical protein
MGRKNKKRRKRVKLGASVKGVKSFLDLGMKVRVEKSRLRNFWMIDLNGNLLIRL